MSMSLQSVLVGLNSRSAFLALLKRDIMILGESCAN